MRTTWREYALHLRNVLKEINVPVTPCLPGESEECGHSDWHHCVSYLAALQARAEDGIWHMHHDDPGPKQLAEELLEFWRGRLADSRPDNCRLDLL